jgi:hypothetical protein
VWKKRELSGISSFFLKIRKPVQWDWIRTLPLGPLSSLNTSANALSPNISKCE